MTFRESATRCIEANPNDYLSHAMLGRYYLSLGLLSWVERTLTKNFTNVKFDGGLPEAEREFRKAHECRGDWLSTGLLMARVLLAQKKPIEEVRKWIEFGLRQPVLEAWTGLEKPELEELAAKLKII